MGLLERPSAPSPFLGIGGDGDSTGPCFLFHLRNRVVHLSARPTLGSFISENGRGLPTPMSTFSSFVLF